LRGGGGNFGVVTSFQYQLYAVGPTVLGGMVIYPLAQAKEVLTFYRDYANSCPDDVTAFAFIFTSPEGAPVVAMLLGYLGNDLAAGKNYWHRRGTLARQWPIWLALCPIASSRR